MRGSRCVVRRPHRSAGTAGCGSHQDERAPASQTGLSCWGGCGASSHYGQKTGILHKSQRSEETGAGWGEIGEKSPHQSDCVSESENGVSPAPEPQPVLREGNSGHRCDCGSSPWLGHHTPPACSDRGLLRHHRWNAGTCYG